MSGVKRECAQRPRNHTRTCNKLPDVHMCTPEPALMDMDRGTLARIDRRLLAGLGDDEAYRTLRVPTTGAKWSTWKRYCDSVGVSMGGPSRCLSIESSSACSVTSPATSCPCSLNGPRKSSRPRGEDRPESVRSIRMRNGSASGASGCDGGRRNSRPENNGPNLLQRLHHLTRRLAQDRSQRTVPVRVRPQVQALPRPGRPPYIMPDTGGHG